MFLAIPWFRLEQWDVDADALLVGVLVLCVLAAVKPALRQEALSTFGFAVVARIMLFALEMETVPVQPFGVLVAIGVLAGSRLAEWHAKSEGLHPAVMADFITHAVSVGFFGAFFLNGLFYETDKLVELLTEGEISWLGLSSYGGFVGALVGVFLWGKRRKLPTLLPSDVICFGLPLGWFFGRMGCFTVHDHPGRETDFFLGVEDWYGSGVTRHDLGLYEVIWSAAVVLFFLWLRRLPNRPTGLFCVVLPLLYAPIRFCLDFLRETPEHAGDIRYGGLTPAQYASIGFFLLALYMLTVVRKGGRREMPPEARWPPVEPSAPAPAKTGKAAKKRGAKR